VYKINMQLQNCMLKKQAYIWRCLSVSQFQIHLYKNKGPQNIRREFTAANWNIKFYKIILTKWFITLIIVSMSMWAITPIIRWIWTSTVL